MEENKTRNFILSRGEKLITPVSKSINPPDKSHPYSIEEAVHRLVPQIKESLLSSKVVSPLATPNDFIVIKFILHPSYLAKSYFPTEFFLYYDLVVIGSKEVQIIPEKWTQTKQDKETLTLEIFVVGRRDQFESLVLSLSSLEQVNESIRNFEKIEFFNGQEKEKGFSEQLKEPRKCEVVLQATGELKDFAVSKFLVFARSLGIVVDSRKQQFADGLIFIPVTLTSDEQKKIDEYTFLRVLRPMPEIRFADSVKFLQRIDLKNEITVLSKDFRAAILDGGYISNLIMDPLVSYQGQKDISFEQGEQHGTMVTAAYLFGNLDQIKSEVVVPSSVDCWQVYEPPKPLSANEGDSIPLYETIVNIKKVLSEHPEYRLVNLSIGPRMPITDDEVTFWTATIDKLAYEGKRLISVAVGNDGNLDKQTGNARIQPPSDAMNTLSVGSANSESDNWERASYSCIGKGRSPGIVKPDILDFGGSSEELFSTICCVNDNCLRVQVQGTSFASPYALRKAAILKSLIGPDLLISALKALVIHNSYKTSKQRIEEVGWGRVDNKIERIVTCADNQVTVLYQGKLSARNSYRLSVPLPKAAKDRGGSLKISITMCYLTSVNPAHPSAYSQSGVEITLYKKMGIDPINHKKRFNSIQFLKGDNYKCSEHDLRIGNYKWENTIKHSKTYRDISEFTDPFFIVHYIPRVDCGIDGRNKSMEFAFILTLEAKNDPELYNHVRREFQMLEELRPIVPYLPASPGSAT